ncbi:2OG-Fe(II) oxygenase [Sphingomonas sanxanigenens]
MNADSRVAGPDLAGYDLAGYDWDRIADALDAEGWAMLPRLLDADQADAVAALYDRPDGFRSHVVMARHGFGKGEYRYFAYPLPDPVAALRAGLYPRLAPIANAWHARMGMATRFPADHAAYLDACHAAGQRRPTPLLLRYGPGDHNCLHQDLYGEAVFPLQAAVLLSAPRAEFTGGDFVLTEQRPRMQSRVEVVPLEKGDAVIFAVNARPRRGSRGDYRVALRHGVGTVRSGRRHTLGIIFHDAA